MAEIRLNKWLSDAGFCSRREADRLIEAGKIAVDGKPACVGMRISEGQNVSCGGTPVKKKDAPVLLAVNKPRGIVCTTSQKDRAKNIVEFLNYPARIYPVGRLDKDSEGLILMTNQGDLVNRMMRAGNFHEKEYLVRIDRPVTEEFVAAMSGGLYLKELGVRTRPCRVEKTGGCEFRIVLTQGLNRQIRRMCGELGCRVEELKRVRIMNITLGRLKTGEYRSIEGEEYRELIKLLRGSSNLPCAKQKKERCHG